MSIATRWGVFAFAGAGRRGRSVGSSVFAVIILLTFFTWATLGTLRLGDQFHPPVPDVATALYVAVVTVSSVGFGDIVPSEPEARLFVVAMIALGILVGATALGAILLPLIGGRLREILGGRADVDRSSHYVIVGRSPLARSTGTERAKGVLALSTDDATNGFVVLGVNELDASIPTVAAPNDASNQFRVKRCQPSMVLSLQALGGELLAMALTGERVDVGMLAKVLQVQGVEPKTEP